MTDEVRANILAAHGVAIPRPRREKGRRPMSRPRRAPRRSRDRRGRGEGVVRVGRAKPFLPQITAVTARITALPPWIIVVTASVTVVTDEILAIPVVAPM